MPTKKFTTIFFWIMNASSFLFTPLLIPLFLVVLYYLCMYYYFPYYLCLHGMIQYILGTSPTKTKKTFGTSTTNNKTTGTNSLFSCYGGALIGKFTDGGILLYRNSLSKYSIIHINTKNYFLNTLLR